MVKYPAARRLGAGGVAAAALAALAACGGGPGSGEAAGTAPPTTASAAASAIPPASNPVQGSVPVGAGPALCAAIGQLHAVTITRVVTLRNRLYFPFPATVRLTDPAAVRAVASAACQLPQLPRVMMTCPADLGISYRLVFTAPRRSYPALAAAATGCAKLVGLDVTRQAVPSFWVTLGRAMKLRRPSAASFGGIQY